MALNKIYLKIKVLTSSYSFNNSFSSIVKAIVIENLQDDKSNLLSVDDPTFKAIAKCENHPSISRIKSYMKKICIFLLNLFIKQKFQRQ